MPSFGEWFTNTVASEKNPLRDGMYVKTITIPSGQRRMNPGTWWELTDGKGRFWRSNPEWLVLHVHGDVGRARGEWRAVNPKGPTMRVLMLVGVYREDWDVVAVQGTCMPTVAGCVDGGTWEVEGDEDTERRWKACKEVYDPRGGDYEWREVWVNLDEQALREHFQVGAVPATVEAPKSRGEGANG